MSSERSKFHIFCIHGVNHSRREQENFHLDWKTELNLPQAELTNGSWPSANSSLKDTYALTTNKKYREQVLSTVGNKLQIWLERTTGCPRIVLMHSMGTAIGARLLSEVKQPVTGVGCGSPLTHPVLGPLLEASGLGATDTRNPVILVQNSHDGITSVGWRSFSHSRKPKNIRSIVQIDVDAPRTFWPGEHPTVLYFSHRKTRSILQKCK